MAETEIKKINGRTIADDTARTAAKEAKSAADAAVKTVNGVKPDENGNVQIETGSKTAVDSTLTVSGAAADAAVVGEKFTEQSEKIEEVNGKLEIVVTVDDEGNAVIKTMYGAEVNVTDDGNGNVTIGG